MFRDSGYATKRGLTRSGVGAVRWVATRAGGLVSGSFRHTRRALPVGVATYTTDNGHEKRDLETVFMSDHNLIVSFDPKKGSAHRIESDLREKELAAIGYVTVQWAYLEHAILSQTLRIAENNKAPVDDKAFSLSFENRRTAWRKSIEQHVTDATERKALLKLCSKVASLETRRHRLTHGLWGWERDDPETLRAYSFRPRVTFDVNFDFDGLMELGFRIGEVNFQLTFPGGEKEASQSAADLANEPSGYASRSYLLSVMDRTGKPKRRPRQGVPRQPKRPKPSK